MKIGIFALAGFFSLAQVGNCISTKEEVSVIQKEQEKISPWINSGHIDIYNHDKIILLDFWITSCEPCVQAFPTIQKYADKYKDKITIIGVTPSRQENAPILYIKRFIEKRGITFPHYVDNGPLHKKYDIQTYPTYILIDNKNKVTSTIPYKEIESELEKIVK